MKYDWKFKLKCVEDYKQGKWTEKPEWTYEETLEIVACAKKGGDLLNLINNLPVFR